MPKKKAVPIEIADPVINETASEEVLAADPVSAADPAPPPDAVQAAENDAAPPPGEAPPQTDPVNAVDDRELDGDAEEGYDDLLNEISLKAADEKVVIPNLPPLLLDQDSALEDGGEVEPPIHNGSGIKGSTERLLESLNLGAADLPSSPRRTLFRSRDRILTINARDEVESAEEREATLWHDIQHAYRTHRILSGQLDSVERNEVDRTLAIVNYNGFRVVIPLSEMLLDYGTTNLADMSAYDIRELQVRRLYRRMGSEIDFVVKGIENSSRSIVASRREAMYRKRQSFYFDLDDDGIPMIFEGRIVQARVVDVGRKAVRVEAFGVECNIKASAITHSWFVDASEKYDVGDTVLVRVNVIEGMSAEDLRIRADIRSVQHDDSSCLSKCAIQGRYVGKVTDVRAGVFFLRLNNGVNAIAHSCYDLRTPGRNDDVSFVVTRLDGDHDNAVGIITRIIRQNL